MKKILILANNDIGLYKFRKELISALISQGDKVYISLPYGKFVEPLKEIGCEFIDTTVDRRGINPITDLKLLVQYNKMVRNLEPDLILTYTIKPNIYGGLIANLTKTPYIVNITGLGTAFHGNVILKKLILLLYTIALKNVKKVFFENEGNKNIFVDNNIVKEELAEVMNGAGVNLEEYPFTPMPEEGPIRFLFVGRVMKEKGVDELFEAIKKIKEQYKDVELDIVGPFEDNYEKIVKQLQENELINYYGYQEDVRPYMSRCHCFVLPSYHEGMANVLLEAAAIGRPLITSNIHGCKEAIDENGYLCNEKDCNDLYLVMDKFINLDKNDMKIMGRKSRQLVKNIFDKNKVVERTIREINL